MYIDVALIDDFRKRYPSHYEISIEKILEECGIWCTIASTRAKNEDPDITLEEICSVYYFAIEGNKIFFCNPDEFWDDVEEYFSST